MANYYVSSTGNDSANGTSTGTPWKTLTKVQTVLNNGTIVPGDTISFKCGDTFTGKMLVANIWGYTAKSGTSGSPITLNSYGSGAKPKFTYPTGGTTAAESRVLMWFIGLSYYVIDGLEFTDLDTTNNKITPANCGVPIYLGSSDGATNHFTIQNCNVNLTGMGFVLWGSNNIVQNCNMSNFKNLKSTPSTVNPYEDYGANPLTIIDGSNNQILNNYVSGGWSESLDFGFNGGFCEMFGSCNSNVFKYNTIIDCNGVSEFGANSSAASSSNNLYAYNKIIDCGAMFYCNISGVFACQVANTKFYNNTVIETNNSRFSLGSTNAGAGVVSQEARNHINLDSYMFLYNGTPTASTVYDVKNNVFQIATPLKIARSTESRLVHSNNYYKITNNSSNTGYTINNTETKDAVTAIFTSTTGTDATQWDLRPASGSPLINKGIEITGLTVDLEGNAISGAPDAGAYERVGSPVLAVIANATTIACAGGTSTVTVAATGGTAPYTGTGTFTVSAGTYNYTVTDNAAGSASVTITVPQPVAITASVTFNPIGTNGGTTDVTVSNVSGGSGTYTYKIDSGNYQTSSILTSVLAGAHTVYIKDSNDCVKSYNISITEPANSTVSIRLVSKTNVTRRYNNTILSPRNGSVTLAGIGGTLPYKFNINGASFRNTTGIFTNLSAGIHSFGIKDALGNKDYITVTILNCSSGTCV